MPMSAPINLYAGDKYRVKVLIKGLDDTPIPLPTDGWNAHTREGTERKAHSAFTIDTTEASTGVLYLSMTGAQTQELPSGVWDLELTTINKTFVYGDLTVIRDVTRLG